MSEQRRFTVEEANAMLPTVIPLLERLRDANAEMEEHHDDVVTLAATNGGGATHQAFLEASMAAAKALGELEAESIVVRDPESGLIDFPAERDGEAVLLCFQLGEAEVAWWHPPETGFAGRRPL